MQVQLILFRRIAQPSKVSHPEQRDIGLHVFPLILSAIKSIVAHLLNPSD
jgi:hypothetical protein